MQTTASHHGHNPLSPHHPLPHEAGGNPHPNSYEAQIYNDAWGRGDGDSGDDDSLAKVDRALAMEVNIPLDHKGELVAFREVRSWKVPSQQDLCKLKNRINDEWIKPLNLKQQDIVRASGLGAPYVCYLLKDPNSPNMNRRRKIEAYSVLTELFRKYDTKLITNEDFIRLRNQRVASRFQGPRQDRTRTALAGGKGQVRRRRRRGPYGEDAEDEDDESSVVDDDLTDARARRKRRNVYPQGLMNMGSYDPSGMMFGGGPGPGMPGPGMQAMKGGYMSAGPGGYAPQQPPSQSMMQVQAASQGGMMAGPANGYGHMMGPPAASYPAPTPWIANANVPFWPTHQYVYAMARGQRPNDQGDMIETPEGQPFPAPYPPGFPPVYRSIVSLNNVVDGPPLPRVKNDRVKLERSLVMRDTETAHDHWIRQKVSMLAKPVVVPRFEQGETVLREPSVHSFVFLVNKDSRLLPIGVHIMSGSTDSQAGDLSEIADLWDVNVLRRDAESHNWLDENRDWEDSLWVLWDIKETGTAVQALFDKWRLEHSLSEEDVQRVARCFLSQFVFLRDVELSFEALLPHAGSNEDFFREIEINCDLLEERIRVKDAFVWDIRATDWDLTALLSNFVSDFQLDSPAISSLFIDLKTTILRHRKNWVTHTLERLTAEGRIDHQRLLPQTLGLNLTGAT